MNILAIDPGNEKSAYCIIDKKTYKPKIFGITENDYMLECIYTAFDYRFEDYEIDTLAIEMIASYGMAVGATVFDTCVWIGRFVEAFCYKNGGDYNYIYRKDVKMNLCHSMKANDSNVRQALIDRFGVVGTKSSPGWFYGFKKDIWAAYACGVTYLDSIKGDGNDYSKRSKKISV